MEMMNQAKAASNLTPSELADAVSIDIAGILGIDTREHALVSELVERYEKAVGIERDEDGYEVIGGWKS